MKKQHIIAIICVIIIIMFIGKYLFDSGRSDYYKNYNKPEQKIKGKDNLDDIFN